MGDVRLPFQNTIEEGLRDLSASKPKTSVPALLVSIGAPRLKTLGFSLKCVIPDPEKRLYKKLSQDTPTDKAHSLYNSLIRRLVSFERAAACAKSRH
ncbi:MAG: hypothetical protein AABZ44_06585 [Elusimicrobiota bacterium]